jgi:hypothetical protein
MTYLALRAPPTPKNSSLDVSLQNTSSLGFPPLERWTRSAGGNLRGWLGGEIDWVICLIIPLPSSRQEFERGFIIPCTRCAFSRGGNRISIHCALAPLDLQEILEAGGGEESRGQERKQKGRMAAEMEVALRSRPRRATVAKGEELVVPMDPVEMAHFTCTQNLRAPPAQCMWCHREHFCLLQCPESRVKAPPLLYRHFEIRAFENSMMTFMADHFLQTMVGSTAGQAGAANSGLSWQQLSSLAPQSGALVHPPFQVPDQISESRCPKPLIGTSLALKTTH